MSLFGGIAGGLLGGIGGIGGSIFGASAGSGIGSPGPAPYNPGNYKDRTGIYAGAPDMATYQQTAGDVNHQGIDKYRSEALRTGPSAWAGLQGQQQNQQYNQAMNQAGAQTASATASAEGALAQRGGLSSGARERVQKQGLLAQVGAGQNLASQRAGNMLQIGVNDEQNRVSQLGALPGMENTAMALPFAREQAQNQLAQSNNQLAGMIWGSGQAAAAQDPRNPASANYDDGHRWYNPTTWFQGGKFGL